MRAFGGTRPRRSSTPLAEKPVWRILVAPAALKALRRLNRIDRERIAAAIDALPAGDVLRLKGSKKEWRLRVGDWRVRFERDDLQRRIDVLTVLPRGRAYKP